MSFGKYITSRVFFAQILAAIFFYWITFITNHGDEITVPNLGKMSEDQVDDKLNQLGLDYQIIDTVDYKPEFPKMGVVQQDPSSGSKVKAGRIIYLTINASTYKMVSVPDLIEKTYRQAVPTLKAIGLLEGEVRYVPYLGKDMVLEMWINGKKIKPGMKVLKKTKVDLVLGDGEVIFDDSEVDSIVNVANKIERELEKQNDTIKNAE
jgi:eukaryotic-like serine/threonine-protein kinase